MFSTHVKLSWTCAIFPTFTSAATCFLLGDHGKQKNENELQSMFPKANKATWMAYLEKIKLCKKIDLCEIDIL
jgi:hypothetical protein